MRCQREKQGLGESRGWRDGGKSLSLASEVGKGEITEYRNGEGREGLEVGFLAWASVPRGLLSVHPAYPQELGLSS